MAVVIEAALIRPPSYSDSVFKDECLFSFQTPESEGGLNVCLECYQGFAPLNVTDKTNYTFSHYSVTGHSLFLNIQKFFQKEVQEQQLQKKLKLDKVQILQENEDDYYVSEYKLVSVEKDFAVPLSVSQISGSYQVLNPDISDNIKATIVGVLEATSMKMKNDIQSWEQEIKPCKHSEKLQQSVSGNYILPKACVTCGLQENLWICLHCGNIGCGREQFGGLKGNSHALKHNDYTQHPVAVKLGSLSLKQGKADCYCYECNDEVKVIDLADKLKVFGINTQSFSEQNEKTLTELNIQQNLTWQFNMESDTGELLEPVFGKSLVGLKNLGNSCYINSTIQVLAHLKSFQDIFYGKDYFNFPLESLQKPYDDLYLQLIKIYNGVVSDKYSKPNMNSTDSIKWQKGLSLAIFKSLIGKANEEFKSQNQQDAFEFLLFFFDQMETYYYKHNSLDSSCFKENPVDRFKFVMNNKLVLDNKFKIHKELDNYLMLNLPEQVDRTDEDGIIQYKKVDINEAIHDHFTSNELLDLGGQDYVKYNRLASLPDLLLVQIQRAKLVNWVPTKTSVPVIVPDEKINLSQYVLSVNEAQAEASSSKLILEEEEEEETKETFEANQEVMNNLLQMGFPENRCKKALLNVGNSSNPEDAMNWLFAHMEDPDIDEPLVLPAGGMTKDFNEPSDEQVNNLVAMGFTEKLAKKALYVNGKNPEAAVEWLFNNPDDNGEIDKATDKPTGQPCAKDQIEQILASTRDIISEKDAEYYLKGVVCHKGNSIHTGHYVSFIRQKYEGKVQWVLYNDEKVVLANDKKNMDEIEKNGYLFLFVKHGSVDDEFSEA